MFFDKDVEAYKSSKYLTEKELYELAKKRVKIKKGFAIHAGVYSVVNFSLFVMNMLTVPSYLWFLWPMLGWGIGLGSHYVALVAKLRFDLKDSAIQREMDYLSRKFNSNDDSPL